ncbi:hypothetical protein N7452_005053 [Penicillium brevicompactum]|uniref:Protein kinase domain-containing protein n=1 Tax=Penicillium brevicompactum TaxID=5074 RepID=A0A9W9QI33_PENBR|nr:hypothetical protein N7452_005053 [Penicillium brevicompactum]
MANSSPDYKKLFFEAEERRKQAEDEVKQGEERRRQEEQRRKQAEEEVKQEEQRRKRAEDVAKQERERNRQTTFMEFICHCHNLFSRPLKVATPSRSTTGTIPLPKGKHCPIRLRPWGDCIKQQQAVYDRVCHYLQPNKGPPELFPSLIALKGAARYVTDPMSSEQNLEAYEQIAVERHVRDVISELCKIPAAREEFMLGDGVHFDNHKNALKETFDELSETELSNTRRPRPDQFCVHRVDGNTNSLLLTVEYKPPHKLSAENLRAGLRPMELWDELVNRNTIPTDPAEKMQYNAELLSTSALVQTYDVMIEEGRAHAILTNGLARVLLYVSHDDPATLNYHLCEPNREIAGQLQSLQQPITSFARELCLCLMSFRSPTRNQEWRALARSQVQVWETSFDRIRSLIPKAELQKSPQSDNVTPSPGPSSSDYQPSSPLGSSTTGRQIPTRSRTSCAPTDTQKRTPSPDSSGSDSTEVTSRKRGFSQVMPSSTSAQRAARQRETGDNQYNRSRHHNAQFCTQRCLLALQDRDILDDACPNVGLHRQGDNDCNSHPITSEDLVLSLKTQLDENIDRCTPIGKCGAYGAPFKLTCLQYGYTVIGKGTTSELWKLVSREVQVYQILRKAQGSAVPVFLGTIDLAKTYFLHGAGAIRHMLLMGWGGECTATMELTPSLRREIRRSDKEIQSLGIIHEDLRRENILWSEELKRALIIDFHRSTLKSLPTFQRKQSAKRRPGHFGTEKGDAKRLRV